jgi:hypothetical protein
MQPAQHRIACIVPMWCLSWIGRLVWAGLRRCRETVHERWLLTKLSDNGTLIFFTVDETLRHLR